MADPPPPTTTLGAHYSPSQTTGPNNPLRANIHLSYKSCDRNKGWTVGLSCLLDTREATYQLTNSNRPVKIPPLCFLGHHIVPPLFRLN